MNITQLENAMRQMTLNLPSCTLATYLIALALLTHLQGSIVHDLPQPDTRRNVLCANFIFFCAHTALHAIANRKLWPSHMSRAKREKVITVKIHKPCNSQIFNQCVTVSPNIHSNHHLQAVVELLGNEWWHSLCQQNVLFFRDLIWFFVWFSFMSNVFINFCVCVVACEFYHMAVPLVFTIWFFFHSFFCMTMFWDESMRGRAYRPSKRIFKGMIFKIIWSIGVRNY